MTSSIRKKKVNAHINERDFPFVVQIAVPDGGFECTLDPSMPGTIKVEIRNIGDNLSHRGARVPVSAF
jgi:hypothetical protein